MTVDVPLFISFTYIYFMMNFYGWGLLQTKQFVTFCLFIVLLYLVSGLLGFFGKYALMLKAKICLVFIFLIVSVYIVTISFMSLRHNTHVTGFISDSAVQIEIAGRYLLLGKNPYTENYFNTDFEKVPYVDEVGSKKNPALYHYAYPPMLTILSAVGFRTFSQLIGFFDIRIIYLIFYFLFFLLGLIKFGMKEGALLFLILVCLNPIFTILLTQGANDIVVITFLLWSLFLLDKGKIVPSAVLLGLAIATKQTAWLAAPFFLFYAWKVSVGKNFILRAQTPRALVRGKQTRRSRPWRAKEAFAPISGRGDSLGAGPGKFITYCTIAFFIALALYLPFIVWDARSMLDDLIFYMSGSTTNSYPIKNFGFGMFLVSTGFIKSVYDYYPFWIWQVSFGLLMLSLFFYSQKRHTTSQNILYGYTIFICLIWFFNRFLNYNYLAYVLVLSSITYVWGFDKVQKSGKKPLKHNQVK